MLFQIIKRLDGYRAPADNALGPPKPLGGFLRLLVFVLWFIYIAFATLEYIRKPNVTTTTVTPSSDYISNFVNFSMPDTEQISYGESFFMGKAHTTGACDTASANASISGGPVPLCPYVLGASTCGVDQTGPFTA